MFRVKCQCLTFSSCFSIAFISLYSSSPAKRYELVRLQAPRVDTHAPRMRLKLSTSRTHAHNYSNYASPAHVLGAIAFLTKPESFLTKPFLHTSTHLQLSYIPAHTCSCVTSTHLQLSDTPARTRGHTFQTLPRNTFNTFCSSRPPSTHHLSCTISHSPSLIHHLSCTISHAPSLSASVEIVRGLHFN